MIDDVGCTDPYAHNYDPDAEEDDGSCEYPEGTCDYDGSIDDYCEDVRDGYLIENAEEILSFFHSDDGLYDAMSIVLDGEFYYVEEINIKKLLIIFYCKFVKLKYA